MASKKGRIKVVKNGPYLVQGSLPLVKAVVEADAEGVSCNWREDERIPTREVYTLCRCGASKTQPFCDGSHGKTHFDGTEKARREPYIEQAKTFDGPELILRDAKPLCVGAGFCVRAGNIWNLTTNSDNPQYKATAIEEAGDCPSGRLVVEDRDGIAIEPNLEPSLALTVDQYGVEGALWVRGGVEIESSDGYVYEVRNRVTLCRCGRSLNKPLCDGSHIGEDASPVGG